MNILLISNMYPSKKFPSFGSFIRNIEEGLMNNHNCNIHKVIIDRNNLKPVGKVFVYLQFVVKCIYTIFKQRHDIVYIHFVSHSYIPLLFLPKFLIRKLVINFHGTDLFSKNTILKRVNIIAIRKANLIVVPSEYFKRILLDRFGKNDKDVFVSPSGGISEHFFQKHKLSKKDSIICGYVGRVIDKKGWKIFVKALSELKKNNCIVEGVIVGSGDAIIIDAYIRKMDMSENIDYLGAIPHKNLPEIYQKLDLFIFPTLFDESLGLVPIEAMANSVPAICSDFEAVRSYIEDGYNGFLFEKGNAEELTGKIISYINLNQTEKNNLCKAAYEKALEYRSLAVGMNLYKMFKKL